MVMVMTLMIRVIRVIIISLVFRLVLWLFVSACRAIGALLCGGEGEIHTTSLVVLFGKIGRLGVDDPPDGKLLIQGNQEVIFVFSVELSSNLDLDIVRVNITELKLDVVLTVIFRLFPTHRNLVVDLFICAIDCNHVSVFSHSL